MWSEVAQLCPTLYDPMDCSLPGSSVRGIFQARVLEWVAISFSRGSSPPRSWTRVSCSVGRRFTIWATREVLCRIYFTYIPFSILVKKFVCAHSIKKETEAGWSWVEYELMNLRGVVKLHNRLFCIGIQGFSRDFRNIIKCFLNISYSLWLRFLWFQSFYTIYRKNNKWKLWFLTFSLSLSVSAVNKFVDIKKNFFYTKIFVKILWGEKRSKNYLPIKLDFLCILFVMKTVWYWWKNRQISGTEEKVQKQTHKYSQILFDYICVE